MQRATRDTPARSHTRAVPHALLGAACILVCAAQAVCAQVAIPYPPSRGGPHKPAQGFPQNFPQGVPTMQPLPAEQPEPPMVELVALAQDGTVEPVAEDARAAWETSVAFIPERARAASIDRTHGTLVRTDGQRHRGTLNTEGDAPRWQCAWGEPRTLRREGVRAIILAGDDTAAPHATAAHPAPTTTDDIIQLSDGGRLSGVVTTLATDGVHIEHGAAGAPTATTVPWGRVRSVSFAGRAEPPPPVLVWLTDGSIIGATTARWESAEVLRIDPAPHSTEGRLQLRRAMMLGAVMQSERVVPLAALAPAAAEASEGAGLRYTLTPPITHGGRWALGAAPIEIEGPVKLVYPPLAAPATLTMCASLDPTVRAVGVVEIVVRAAGRELHRSRLDAEHGERDVRVELPAGPFDIELLSADGSAVGDVVHLERALLISHAPA